MSSREHREWAEAHLIACAAELAIRGAIQSGSAVDHGEAARAVKLRATASGMLTLMLTAVRERAVIVRGRLEDIDQLLRDARGDATAESKAQ